MINRFQCPNSGIIKLMKVDRNLITTLEKYVFFSHCVLFVICSAISSTIEICCVGLFPISVGYVSFLMTDSFIVLDMKNRKIF